MAIKNTPQDFWKYVDKQSNSNGCWEWQGQLTHDGYGIFWLEGKRYRAHRYIFGNTNLIVRHCCDNRRCVNPAHLISGTNLDNSQDMVIRNRQAQGIKAGNSKLSEQQVLEIRKSLDSNKIISQKYGIHVDTVSQIRQRKTWRHI